MKNKKIRIKIKQSDLNIRNEMHFDIQRATRAQIFKDKTKYTRKLKHKNKDTY